MSVDSAPARSFDAWAVEYDRYRPGYPAALFDEIAQRLALPEAAQVVDLGAGTGRASLAMARRGWHVTAVDPGGSMLDVLRASADREGLSLDICRASAEDTALESDAFDLATAAQAFHWFDHARAMREMGRIVRPGGGIALFWNIRDASASPLLSDYNALLGTYGITAATREAGRHPDTRRWIAGAGVFEEADFFQLRHVVEQPPEAVVGLAFTASYVRALPPRDQERLAGELEALVERHAARAASVRLPYVVDCEVARRRSP